MIPSDHFESVFEPVPNRRRKIEMEGARRRDVKMFNEDELNGNSVASSSVPPLVHIEPSRTLKGYLYFFYNEIFPLNLIKFKFNFYIDEMRH